MVLKEEGPDNDARRRRLFRRSVPVRTGVRELGRLVPASKKEGTVERGLDLGTIQPALLDQKQAKRFLLFHWRHDGMVTGGISCTLQRSVGE
jgi:hypothetical protein